MLTYRDSIVNRYYLDAGAVVSREGVKFCANDKMERWLSGKSTSRCGVNATVQKTWKRTSHQTEPTAFHESAPNSSH
jgi:hypothetical protein